MATESQKTVAYKAGLNKKDAGGVLHTPDKDEKASNESGKRDRASMETQKKVNDGK